MSMDCGRFGLECDVRNLCVIMASKRVGVKIEEYMVLLGCGVR